MIPYEYLGVEHNYLPDYLVRLSNGVTLLLGDKRSGRQPGRRRKYFDSARRWISAVNNWGKLGTWDLHVCRNPQMLEKELEHILRQMERGTMDSAAIGG